VTDTSKRSCISLSFYMQKKKNHANAAACTILWWLRTYYDSVCVAVALGIDRRTYSFQCDGNFLVGVGVGVRRWNCRLTRHAAVHKQSSAPRRRDCLCCCCRERSLEVTSVGKKCMENEHVLAHARPAYIVRHRRSFFLSGRFPSWIFSFPSKA
jgi:hypothetical protein